MKAKQRGDDHKLYCPTCKAGRNCMDHLMIRENDLQEQVTQLKADLATAKQGLDLEMAEQQFTGYRYAEQNSGRSIIGLCEAMGLTEKEWTAVRERVQWLGKSNIEDIDEHFEEQNDER